MPLSEAWVDFVAGWVSGGVSVLALQPVDTVLTRWQAGLVTIGGSTTYGGRPAAASTVSASTAALTMAQTAGVQSLWRGAAPMISAVPVQNAVLMCGYGLGQNYAEMYSPHHKLTAIFVGGCTGGILQSFLMSPVELIKVSTQVHLHANLWTTSRQVLRGFLVWGQSTNTWRGLNATLLRDGIPHGVWFVSYEMCKDYLYQSQSTPLLRTDDGTNNHDLLDVGAGPVPRSSSWTVPLISGAVAATVAWAVGYPADLIKTRQQASKDPLGVIPTAQQIIRESNGRVLGGLYRGFGLKLVRAIPASMIGFSVYEFIKASLMP